MKIEQLPGFHNRIFNKKPPAQHGLAGLPTPRFIQYYFPLQFLKLKTAIMKNLLCTYQSAAGRQWRLTAGPRLLLLFFMLVFTATNGQAQSITGKVTDADG